MFGLSLCKISDFGFNLTFPNLPLRSFYSYQFYTQLTVKIIFLQPLKTIFYQSLSHKQFDNTQYNRRAREQLAV